MQLHANDPQSPVTLAPARRRPRRPTWISLSSTVVAAIVLLFAGRAEATDWGFNVTSASSVQFFVHDAAWADLHYIVNGGVQLNVRMVASGVNHSYDVTGLHNGDSVRYFFTVGQTTGATDTAWTTFTFTGTTGGGGGGTGTGNWVVVWEDQFTGSGQPDPASWNYHVGNGFNPGAQTFDGWGNGEWEWYRPENAFQQGGNLVIRADYNTTATTIAGRQWFQRSSRLTTKGKRTWTYGRFEARIAMPNAVATWPAFWMMGAACDDTFTSNYNAPITYFDTMASNWSSCGEIDIMEHRNTETNTFQNLFWDSRIGVFPWADGQNNQAPGQAAAGNVSQFHLYTIEWEPTQIRWYIDRDTNPNPVHTIDITPATMEEFHKPFYVILNLALSGQFTGNAQPNIANFPLTMNVDYVRVWQRQ